MNAAKGRVRKTGKLCRAPSARVRDARRAMRGTIERASRVSRVGGAYNTRPGDPTAGRTARAGMPNADGRDDRETPWADHGGAIGDRARDPSRRARASLARTGASLGNPRRPRVRAETGEGRWGVTRGTHRPGARWPAAVRSRRGRSSSHFSQTSSVRGTSRASTGADESTARPPPPRRHRPPQQPVMDEDNCETRGGYRRGDGL